MRDLFLFAPREPRTSRPRSHRPPRRRFGGRWLQGDARPPPPPVGGAGERGPRKSDGPGGAPPPPRPGCSCACELPRRRVPAGEGGAGLSWQRARKGRGGRRLLSSGAGRVPATEGLLLRDVCIWLLVQLYCTVILKLSCRALRISLENVQKENTGSFVRTKWNDLCKALSPIHQSREKIQQTFMNLSTSLVEFRLFSRSVLKICGSQTVCHRELIGMPSYVFSFQGTHGDIGHLTTITIKIFGL
uniref:uncharacterized protein LOC118531724 isoform X1 n=1 Tax=Halichoerus grypus TaxID=9711 RepID=UPI0016593288|nr:uncharacterized protein LOC118531724 isoform X1 [Halichoerus grypus]